VRKHLFVLNPAAGKRDNVRELRQRIDALETEEQAILIVTEHPCHAIDIVREQAVNHDGLLVAYACGGDGTLNEVINGAAGLSNVHVTHYPCGTGNDFLKCFDGKVSDFLDISALMRGETMDIDLYSVNGRYGINIGSVGLDSRVGAEVHRFKRWPLVNHKMAYNLSVLYNVAKGVGANYHVSIDGQLCNDSFTLLNACNGRYYGGGFYAMPDAVPNDGLLDFLIVKRVSRFGVAKVIGKYAKGRYHELGDIVTYIRGKKLEVVADKPMPINLDGEIVRARVATFAVAEEKIKFVMPEGVKLR